MRGNRSSPHMCLQERDLELSKNEFIQADIFHILDVPWTYKTVEHLGEN